MSVTTKLDKMVRNSVWENVKFSLKFGTISPSICDNSTLKRPFYVIFCVAKTPLLVQPITTFGVNGIIATESSLHKQTQFSNSRSLAELLYVPREVIGMSVSTWEPV